MSISKEELTLILQQQRQQFEEYIQTLTANLNLKTEEKSSGGLTSAVDIIVNNIPEFHYDPESGFTFDAWFNRFKDIFQSDIPEDDRKKRLLLRKLGTLEHEKFINFILPKSPSSLTFDETVKLLEEIFCEQTSVFNRRYNCMKLVKDDDEDFVTYAGKVNRACERFGFKDMSEDQFRSLIFVCGLQSDKDQDIRTRLLSRLDQDPNINLMSITTECQRLLNLKRDTALVEQKGYQSEPSVLAVNHQSTLLGERQQNQDVKPRFKCWKCGEWHFVRDCPYKKHQCQKCKKNGHKEDYCRWNDYTTSRYNRYHNKKFQSYPVFATFNGDAEGRRKYLTITLNDVPIRFQVDTASDITIISEETWNLVGRPTIDPTNHVARSASGGKLNLLGRVACQITYEGTLSQADCYVSKHPNLNLLGLDWLENLKLLDVPLNSVCNAVNLSTDDWVKQIKLKFPKVFEDGLGYCRKTVARLSLIPDVKPIFRPKRPVPYALLESVDNELERLQAMGVIKPVNYSAWAAPIVIVKKANGTLRICADFSTGLNQSLADHQYPLPLPEDLFTRLNGGQCFAKLDLSEAYLQIEISQESKELLTINTHRGLFQYQRLPFGVKTAPAIFQQIMDTMLQGLPFAAAYLDDIIIMGSNVKELRDRIVEVLKRINEYGFHLRAEKCEFFMESIKYLGFIIDRHGRRPDPANIDAIHAMPPPHDIPTLRSFLGLVSHYGDFIPSMHDLRGPLNDLLKKDTPWKWSNETQQAFEKIKSILTTELLLTHYNPELPIVVASDASSYGIGAVISHTFPDGTEKAIAHAARSLTSAERNYSQIEKEALAIIFAVKKFHKMLYGRKFTLLTDHKPLLAIFASKKGIPVYTANRLQRWSTILLGYDFNIQYISTGKIGQADALSRLIARNKIEEDMVAQTTIEADIRCVLTTATSKLPITLERIREATLKDRVLQKVFQYHKSRWPTSVQDPEIQQFRQRRHALSIVDGCLMFGDRVVVPEILRQEVLKQFHTSHPGINRMKALARSYIYWPSMDAQIENLVRTCHNCQAALKSPTKCELHSWPATTEPWTRIHVDFAGPFNGRYFLVLVDSYSKWPEIFPLVNVTSQTTIKRLQEVFSRFGFPETLVTDNGRQFTSAEFGKFCREHGIKHVRTPPYHPQANGQAERFVDTFKRTMLKVGRDGDMDDALQKFLLIYRITPNPNTPGEDSPADTILKRNPRTVFDLLRPCRPHHGYRNTRMEAQYNRRHGAIPRKFWMGQKVLAKDYRTGKIRWTAGVISKIFGQVCYEVTVGGEKWTRHADQLRTTFLKPRHQNQRNTPLNLLIDEFKLRPPEETSGMSKPPTCQSPENQTRRWSARRRIPVTPLQVDPRLKSYDNVTQTGRC